jgi:hypothetical protein
MQADGAVQDEDATRTEAASQGPIDRQAAHGEDVSRERPQVIPTKDAQLMFEALQVAFGKFVEEYARKTGRDEISDVELRAAGKGFRDIADAVVADNNSKFMSGDRDGLRPATERTVTLRPAPTRVTLTPAKQRR